MPAPLPEPSGCGHGLSRPADTQQQGVRSVLPSRNEAERTILAEEYRNAINDAFDYTIDWRALWTAAQKLADLAGSMK